MTLDGRLRAAARIVCGAPQREDVRAYFVRPDCYRQSIAAAIRDSRAGRDLVAALQQESRPRCGAGPQAGSRIRAGSGIVRAL